MWKVLLVEDEARVRRLIKEIVNWGEMGFEIAGEAANGIEALEAMQETAPHFILCDIMMPRMDGIELLQKARQQGFEGPFVMLTAMNEFELARQALEYGATSYILKLSLNVDTIREMLAKVNRELSKVAIPARQITYRDFELLYRYIWNQIHGNDDAATEIEELLERISAGGFAHVSLCVVLHGSETVHVNELMPFGLIQTIEPPVVHKFRAHGSTTFFSWVPQSEFLHPRVPGECAEFTHSVVWASAVHVSAMESSWRNMIRFMESAWYGSGKRVIFYSEQDASNRQPEISARTLWNMEREIIQAFERRDKDECVRLSNEMFEEMKSKHASMTVVVETTERLDKMFAAISGCEKVQSGDGLTAASHEELRRNFGARIAYRYNNWKRASSLPSGHPEINKIVDYINSHYDKEVTLKSMAELVSLDEYYLSGLFKKKMGDTLIHYLHKVRIDQARFYLLQSTLTIGEIAERIGFGNISYFLKIFKRWAGQTPSEFRKIQNVTEK